MRVSAQPFRPRTFRCPLPERKLPHDSGAGIRDARDIATGRARLLRRSPNILLIAGTSSTAHLRENVAGAALTSCGDDLAELDEIGR